MNAATAAATAVSPPASDRRRWIALIIVCLGQLMIVLDTTIVNVALPKIQHDLHFTQANLTWIINAYLISYGSFLLMAGRLGDLLGRKRIFLSGLVLFTAASAACALAGDQTVLIVSRFVQGLGGALAASVIIAIIVTEFPEAGERAKAMSVFTFVAVAGGSIGLLAGGAITESINWHWIFFINLPIGVIAFLAGRALIDDNPGLGIGEGVDIVGSVLITASAMSLVYSIVKSSSDGWGSSTTLGFGIASLLMGAAFLVYEGRISNPIFPLRVLRLRGLMGSSAVRACLVTGMFSTFFLGAIYFERVRGYSALQTGLAFLPMTLVVATLSLGITARLMRRFGAVPLLSVGMVLPIIGLGLLTQIGPHTSYFPLIFVAYVFVGLGMGTSFMPLLTVAMADVPPADAGLGSGIINVSMQLAAALGLAVLGTIATDHTRALVRAGHSPATALTSGFHLAFGIAAVLVAIGIIIAQIVLRPSPPAAQAAVGTVRETSPGRATATATAGAGNAVAGAVQDGDADAGDMELSPQPA